MTSAPYDMLTFFDADEDDDLDIIEVAGDDREWIPVEPFYPDATLLVVLYRNRGVRHIAVRHDDQIGEFDVKQVIVRDGSPIGAMRS